VLGRLISCAEMIGASDVFRITSESPFLYYEEVPNSIKYFYNNSLDALFFDEIIDGCGFEILRLSALKESHEKGEGRHRSELCTLYIRENHEAFRVERQKPHQSLIRPDLRLTVDYPEDLIVCRDVYEHFYEKNLHIPILDIVHFLDENPHLKKLIDPYTDLGYKMMYK
jgi:spore coat polysaccharide biosynthesis protein SpsF